MVDATGGEITGTTIQLPTSGYHTPRETVSRRSMAATLTLHERLLGLGG